MNNELHDGARIPDRTLSYVLAWKERHLELYVKYFGDIPVLYMDKVQFTLLLSMVYNHDVSYILGLKDRI